MSFLAVFVAMSIAVGCTSRSKIRPVVSETLAEGTATIFGRGYAKFSDTAVGAAAVGYDAFFFGLFGEDPGASSSETLDQFAIISVDDERFAHPKLELKIHAGEHMLGVMSGTSEFSALVEYYCFRECAPIPVSVAAGHEYVLSGTFYPLAEEDPLILRSRQTGSASEASCRVVAKKCVSRVSLLDALTGTEEPAITEVDLTTLK